MRLLKPSLYLDMLNCGFRDRSATHINAMIKTSTTCDKSNGKTLLSIYNYLRHVGNGKPAIEFFMRTLK